MKPRTKKTWKVNCWSRRYYSRRFEQRRHKPRVYERINEEYMLGVYSWGSASIHPRHWTTNGV